MTHKHLTLLLILAWLLSACTATPTPVVSTPIPPPPSATAFATATPIPTATGAFTDTPAPTQTPEAPTPTPTLRPWHQNASPRLYLSNPFSMYGYYEVSDNPEDWKRGSKGGGSGGSYAEDGPGDSFSLVFSHFSNQIAYQPALSEFRLVVADLDNLHPKDVYTATTDAYDFGTVLYWTSDDQHVVSEVESNPELNIIYHLQSQIAEPWPYRCDRLALSPQTGRLATWCAPLAGKQEYAVLEWGGETWFSPQPPAKTLSIVVSPPVRSYPWYGKASLWAWAADGSRIAYFNTRDSHGDLVIADAAGKTLFTLERQAPWLAGDDPLPELIRWSADGRRLAFYGMGPTDNPCPKFEHENARTGDLETDSVTACWQVLDIESGQVIWSLPDYLMAQSGGLFQSERAIRSNFYEAKLSSDGTLLALIENHSSSYAYIILDLQTGEAIHTQDTGTLIALQWENSLPYQEDTPASVPTETATPSSSTVNPASHLYWLSWMNAYTMVSLSDNPADWKSEYKNKYMEIDVAYADNFLFSHYSNRIAYWNGAQGETHSMLTVADLDNLHPRQVEFYSSDYDDETPVLYWTADDQHLLLDFGSELELNQIYHVRSGTIDRWPYTCDRLALSPRTQRLAEWCTSALGGRQAVLEWGGKIWYTSTPPDKVLTARVPPASLLNPMSGIYLYGQHLSLWSWTADGRYVAYFSALDAGSDGYGDLVIASAEGEILHRVKYRAPWLTGFNYPQPTPELLRWSADGRRLLFFGLGDKDTFCPKYQYQNAMTGYTEVTGVMACWHVWDMEQERVIWSLSGPIPDGSNALLDDRPRVMTSWYLFPEARLSPDGSLVAVTRSGVSDSYWVEDLESGEIIASQNAHGISMLQWENYLLSKDGEN